MLFGAVLDVLDDQRELDYFGDPHLNLVPEVKASLLCSNERKLKKILPSRNSMKILYAASLAFPD